MCLATSNNLLLVLYDAPNRIYSTNSRSSGQPKIDAKTLFPHPPSPFPGNFCNCNSGGICIASQFYVQLPLLYTAWSNAYSEIGPGVTLRPLATSCAKDCKGHSLVQTSFTEPPNRQHTPTGHSPTQAGLLARERRTGHKMLEPQSTAAGRIKGTWKWSPSLASECEHVQLFSLRVSRCCFSFLSILMQQNCFCFELVFLATQPYWFTP